MGTTNGSNGSDWWTVKEAAAYIRVSPITLWAWLRFKPSKRSPNRISTPPFRRIGRKTIRIPVAAFKEWASRYDSPEQERT